MRLILASQSPRRAELLAAAGFQFEVRPAHVDEGLHDGEAPEVYVCRVAEAKARAVMAASPTGIVLGADTVVVVGGELLGKPRDAADARRMLQLLSGRTHQVLTAVSLARAVDPAGEAGRLTGAQAVIDTRRARSAVEFAPVSASEVDWYVASGEPMDKAGGYAIQGLASRFVVRIDGSYSNVVGLPVALVYQMCREAGLLLS